MKKPPDKKTKIPNFRTIKVPLKKVLKHYDIIIPKLDNTLSRMNLIISRIYEFIRLYFIYCFENNVKFPDINKVFITKIKSLICERSNRGKKSSLNNEDPMINFYDNIFSSIYADKINAKNLSYIIPQSIDQIITCIETNIKTYFIKYINKFVNISIRDPINKDIKSLGKTKEERKILYRDINKVIKNIKDDLINLKCEKSDQKYHDWINTQIDIIFKDIKNYVDKENKKESEKKGILYYVKKNPQKFLTATFLINKEIENLGRRPYQIIPQKGSYVYSHIILNTSGIIEMINDKEKQIYKIGYSQMNNNAKKYQNHTWKEILKLENKSIFNQKNYRFYNQISTDGFSCSLLFIKKEFYYKKYGFKLPEFDDEFELLQLSDLSKEECDKYKTKKLVGADPGKLDIFTMIDEIGKTYSYSNCRRRFETYTKRSNEIIKAEKKKNKSIMKKETELSAFSKRTLNIDNYINFLTEKQKVDPILNNFYSNILFRKLRFRIYNNTKKSEDKMLNEIEEKYGSDIVIGLGNWSVSKQMRGCIPTPNKRLTKLLEKRFPVLSVDEFKTSKLYNKYPTEELINVKLKKGSRMRSIHKLLTPKRTPNSVIVNRDNNASKNILRILEEYLEYQTRPIYFRRHQMTDTVIVE